jgi:hypothetical protein
VSAGATKETQRSRNVDIEGTGLSVPPMKGKKRKITSFIIYTILPIFHDAKDVSYV